MSILHKRYLRQFTCGLVACSSTLLLGTAASWISATEQTLRSKESPVGPLNNSQISWLGSLPCIGAILGAFVWGKIINKIGRKKAAILTTAPFFISNCVIIFATNYSLLLLPRLFCGVGCMGCLLNSPGYIAEICESKVKSAVASFLMVNINFGSLLLYFLGETCSYLLLNIIVTSIPVGIALLNIFLIPESPVHLIKIGQDKEAKEKLKWLRASDDEQFIQIEYNKLKESFININELSKGFKLSDVCKSSYYMKSLLIGLVLQTSIAMSGIGVMATYQNNILYHALQRSNTNYIALLITLVQVLGSIVSIFIFPRFNRKVFIVGSNLIVTMCLISSGILLYLRSIQVYHVNPHVFIPLFSIYMFVHGLGLSCAVYTTIPELFSAECRNTFSSILLFLHFSLYYITIKLYPILVDTIHLYGWFFIFASYSFFTIFFGYFIVPETKGKSIQQVFNKLSKKNPVESAFTKTHKSKIGVVSSANEKEQGKFCYDGPMQIKLNKDMLDKPRNIF